MAKRRRLLRLTDEQLAGIEFDVRIGGAHDSVVSVEFGPVRVRAIEDEFIGGRIAIDSNQLLPFASALVGDVGTETALVAGAHRNVSAHDVNPNRSEDAIVSIVWAIKYIHQTGSLRVSCPVWAYGFCSDVDQMLGRANRPRDPRSRSVSSTTPLSGTQPADSAIQVVQAVALL